MTFRSGTLLLFAGLVVAATGASAQEINARKHIDPALQVKVNKVMARALRERGTAKQQLGRSGSGSSCGNLVVGESGSGKGASKDVTIVADYIINVNRNCR